MKIERLNLLEQYVQEKGVAAITDIAEHFNTSTNTTRRDIAALIQRGGFKKVYGGIAVEETTATPYFQRRTEHLSEKQTIGKLASTMVDDNMVVFLDSGSTTPHILEGLAKKKNITIITYSLSVLYEAAKYPSLNIIGLGGLFDHSTQSFSGHMVLSELSRLNIHIVFISATCVSVQHGLSNYSFQEAEIKQCVTNCCSHVVLMADYSKFGLVGVRSFFPLNKLSGIVTDRCPPKEFMSVINENHIRLLYPGCPSMQNFNGKTF